MAARSIRSLAVKVFLACALLSFLHFGHDQAGAFELKDHVWGDSLEQVRKKIEGEGRETTFDPSSGTLVYDGVFFGKPCKVSLLFTPDSGRLAGAAFIWSDPKMAGIVHDELLKKYGRPAPFSGKEGVRSYFLWYSPVDRYDRIALIGRPNKTVLGYYGGQFYREYIEGPEQ